MPTQASQQFKELKDLLEESNKKISTLREKVTKNHDELMERVTRVEESTKKALEIAVKNGADIRKIELEQQSLKDEITEELAFHVKEELKEKFNFKIFETQLKGAMIELEDLRNRSMRSTLIFKNIDQKANESWEDTSNILAEFLISEVNLPYIYEEIEMQISKKVNVVVSQMFLKELTEWRSGALKYHREYITNNQDVQIKLEYPATLKSRQKRSHGKWEILKCSK